MRRTTLTLLALAAFACEPAYAGTFNVIDPADLVREGTRTVEPGAGPDVMKRGVADVDAMKRKAGRTVAPSPAPNVNTVSPGTGNFKPLPFESVYKPIPLDQVKVFKPKPRGFNRSVFKAHKSVRGQGGQSVARGAQR